MSRYIVLNKETHEPDWDGETHKTYKMALDSLCSGTYAMYVRTREEAEIKDNRIRVYWEDVYYIAEVVPVVTPVRVERCGHNGGQGIGAGHVCICVGEKGHEPFYGRGHGCGCGAIWSEEKK